jgi:hypothetical protein
LALTFARLVWLRIETITAVTYCGVETAAAGRAAGLTGFWMGYFGFRSAPMGRVGSGVVEATFFNFAPTFVARWVPEVWDRATPESLLPARSDAAVATLTRLCPSVADVAAIVNPVLARGAARGVAAGRPLFAANRSVRVPDEPVAALWQLCTTLREHRGDGHVAALTTAGLDGIEAHVLIAIDHEHDPEDLQRTRGWTADDWDAAVERCRGRDLVDRAGALTEAGRALRQDVEATTDRLATEPWNPLDERDREQLLAALTPAAQAISASGVIRYPNPMGLPPLV